jgi:CHAT domain-containing protein/tetratricopeptide (TPR) repeat protein
VPRSRLSAFGACTVALAVHVATAQGIALRQSVEDDAVRRALAVGDYVRAEAEARAQADRTERIHGPNSTDYARALDMLVEALLRNGRGAEPQTVILARRALTVHEGLDGSEAVEVTAAVHHLGATLAAQGDFSSAVTLHRRGLRIREGFAVGPTSIAQSMEYLAAALMQREEFSEARALLERARTYRASNAPVDDVALALTFELLGTVNRLAGEYAAALPMLDQALKIRHDVGWEHPQTASVIQAKAWILYLTGHIPESQQLWGDALAMFERTLRPEHPTIGIAQRALAIAAWARGHMPEALTRRRAAVVSADVSLGPCDPERFYAYNDLAISLQYEGDYAGAGRFFERKLERIKQCTGTDATDAYATTLYNQADLAAEIGDLAEAERLYQHAIEVWSKALGSSHPFVSVGLDALARTVSARRQFMRAEGIYQRALALRIRTLGPNHPRVAYTLVNMARNLAATGNRSQALQQIARALAIYDAAGSPDEPDNYAGTLSLRGSIEAAMHRYADARRTFGDALSAREQLFGASHPLTAESRADVATADFAVGNYAEAFSEALEAERIGRDHLAFTIRYLPERHATTYAAKRPRGLDLALSMVAGGRIGEAARVFDSAARSRGALLDEFADRARIDTAANPDLRSLTDAVATARTRFATLMMRSLEDGASVSRALLDQARAEKEVAERALAESSAAARAELVRTRIGVDDIRSAMPAESALISFVRYTRVLRPAAAGAALVRAPSYLAFVMRHDDEAIHAVPIGTARSLDALVSNWRRSVAAPTAAEGLLTAGVQLRQAAWDPLVKYLKGLSTVFIVPDGALNLVNFAALPAGRARYLIETDVVFHYLSTERDLIPPESGQTGKGLLAVGGPAFGDASPPPRTASRNGACGEFGALTFGSLPGARAEAQEVAALWPGATSDARVLTGREATETAVKNGATRRRVVHFATHGFFLGGDCQTRSTASRGVGGIVVGTRESAPDDSDNALLKSGLVLAGANRRRQAKPGEDDGILTAEEVAGMDLRGTEWAVLSACDTGIGEIRAGEGVFGLRRAFQIAGAGTVIMSLWSVDDQAARRWMRALYEARLLRQESTAGAVHEATLGLLRDRRSRGQSTHPFYWAAFVAAGNWR